MIKTILKQKGSVALMSILIISAILIILVLGTSETQISTSFQYLNSASNKNLYYSAEACLEESMMKLKSNPNYTGETLTLEGENTTCTILVSGDTTKTISITPVSDNYTQNFEAQAEVTTSGQANNVQLLKWSKI